MSGCNKGCVIAISRNADCGDGQCLEPVLGAVDALDQQLRNLPGDPFGPAGRSMVIVAVRGVLPQLEQAYVVGTSSECDGDDTELVHLEQAWLELMAREAVAPEGPTPESTRAIWGALLALAAVPAKSLKGVLIKVRTLVRFLAESETEAPEALLLKTALEAIEFLVAKMEAARHEAAEAVDALFGAAALETIVPVEPPADMLAAGADAGAVPIDVARAVYTAMLRFGRGKAA